MSHAFLAGAGTHRLHPSRLGLAGLIILACMNNDRLLAAAPLYLKGNSHGEFVFDWSWASAWERAGGDYYPKLLNARALLARARPAPAGRQ